MKNAISQMNIAARRSRSTWDCVSTFKFIKGYSMTLNSWGKFFALLSVIALGGCGGGGGSSVTAPTTGGTSSPTIATGVFVDSAVTNIAYTTVSQSGFTDASGKFKYVEGESVVFSVGKVKLPAVKASGTITPKDIAKTNDVNNPTLTNILIFLQTLDSDGDPSNGISINAVAHTNANTQIDFTLPVANFLTTAAFVDLAANSGSVNKAPVSTTDALQHFSLTLAALGLPTAAITNADSTIVGKTVSLSGAQSTAPSGTTLSYAWTLSVPAGSKAALSSVSAVAPSFAVDMAGTYAISLTVSAGTASSTISRNVVADKNPLFGPAHLYITGQSPSNVALGCLTCSADKADSVCNSNGVYGSSTSATSIWNTATSYGQRTSPQSPWWPIFNTNQNILVPYLSIPTGDPVALFSNNSDARISGLRDNLTNPPTDVFPSEKYPDVVNFLTTFFNTLDPNMPDPATAKTWLCNALASQN